MFKFKARVLLELGAELISSDAVALYELIKNGIDAGSKTVDIGILICMQPSALREVKAIYASVPNNKWDINSFRKTVEERLASSASDEQKAAFMDSVGQHASRESALKHLDAAVFEHNAIVVSDKGSGMTVETLESCYLTVGTPMRMHERLTTSPTDRVPLGEKGIGRLAAMRLGHHVYVETGVSGETNVYELVLDWRPIFLDIDLDANALKFDPKSSAAQKKKSEKGTSIRIKDIQSDWDEEKIKSLSETEFAKLADPFANNFANQFLTVSFQGKKLSFIQAFQSSMLKNADATCEIEFRAGVGDRDEPTLKVTTDYAYYNKAESIIHSGAHLNSALSFSPRGKSRPLASDKLAGSNEVTAALRTLGNFSAKFYWFNRGRIMREQQELWQRLSPFVRGWSGGLLVYRDGFRVYPYGAASDDWLDLDRKALAGSAYKLNRAQIVGYLRISTRGNPKLHDQTNREGFRDCPEKEALRRLLRQAIISDCKTFLERVDKENHAADEDTVREIGDRILSNQQQASDKLKALQVRVPQEGKIITSVLAQLAEVNDAWERAKEALSAHKAEIEQYVHLAGVGLMVELIAHELSRSTDMALDVLGKKNVATSPAKLESLQAQLKTINKRVRVLDELSVPGRQRKTEQNIGDLVALVAELYEFKAERHEVEIVVKKRGRGGFVRRVEKGQILQILDNLLSNSMYWLARRIDRTEGPRITIEIDSEAGTVRVSDNGPGVPASIGNRVFDAFFTTKPSGEGRGLGLYIAKRLATDNEADLSLIDVADEHHAGFRLTFQGKR